MKLLFFLNSEIYFYIILFFSFFWWCLRSARVLDICPNSRTRGNSQSFGLAFATVPQKYWNNLFLNVRGSCSSQQGLSSTGMLTRREGAKTLRRGKVTAGLQCLRSGYSVGWHSWASLVPFSWTSSSDVTKSWYLDV